MKRITFVGMLQLCCLFSYLFMYLLLQSQYEKHKEVSTSQGVKILGKDLEKALAGLPLLVAHKEDEIPVLRVSSRWGWKKREERVRSRRTL